MLKKKVQPGIIVKIICCKHKFFRILEQSSPEYFGYTNPVPQLAECCECGGLLEIPNGK